MKYFLLPLITGLILIASLNIYMDPNDFWRQGDFHFSGNWTSDQYWVAPLRIEERSFRDKQIGFLPKVDVVGLGSSRFWIVDSTMFPAGSRFYNASVSGATVWDYVALWERFKQEGNIPKHLIIFVDTWNFNKNTWLKYRWLPNASLVFRFINDNGETNIRHRKMQISALTEWLTGYFYEWVDLFSPTVLKASLDEFLVRLKHGAVNTNYISTKENRPGSVPAWKNDGGYVYPDDQMEKKSLAEITAISRNIGLGSMNAYMKDWEIDTNAIELMNYLLSDTEKHGVKVLLVQPPFQHTAYEIMKLRPEYKDIPGRYDAIIEGLRASHTNTWYCDALDPRTSACDPTEFIDSAHPLASCTQKIINFCLGHVPQWGIASSYNSHPAP